jgi:hypothetical protein
LRIETRTQTSGLKCGLDSLVVAKNLKLLVEVHPPVEELQLGGLAGLLAPVFEHGQHTPAQAFVDVLEQHRVPQFH